MTNLVVTGVCKGIFDMFGSDYYIYKELVKQNLKEPCFFVECVTPKRTQCLNNRYLRQYGICVHYFPTSENFREECNSVFEKLACCLDYITVDGDLIGTKNLRFVFDDPKNIRSEYSHSIMQVFFDVEFFTYENTQLVDLMEVLNN